MEDGGSKQRNNNDDGVGKGKLILTDSVKRELTSSDAASSKKRKSNEDDEWIHVGRLGFDLEIPRGNDENALIAELKKHTGKMLKVEPHDDSYNPSAIRVAVPGQRFTTIWKYGGDIYLTRFLMHSRGRTKCMACFPEDGELEVMDDPKRKSFWLVPIDIHFYLHKEIDLMDEHKNVKRQVKQLINYMRGGTQPNPAKYSWPIVREEIAEECRKNADLMERLLKKKTAKDWWKAEEKKAGKR